MFVKNLFSVFVPAILACVLSLSLNAYSPLFAEHWLYSTVFFFVFSFIFNLIYAFRVGTENFTQLLIVAIVIRLLLALIAVVVYSLIDKEGFFNFSIHLILHYILF